MVLLMSKGHKNFEGENIYKLFVYEEQDKTKKIIFILSGTSFEDLIEKLLLLRDFFQLDFSHKVKTFINGKAIRNGETIYEATPLRKKEFRRIKRIFIENKKTSSLFDF